MAVEVLPKSKEEIEALFKETDGVLDELSNTLSTVSVTVTKSSPKVIQAISKLFGPQSIRSDGSAVITYNMYTQVNKLLRDIGQLKVKESL